MYVDVLTVTGKCFRVHLRSADLTGSHLKNMIYQQQGIHASFQALTYNDKILSDCSRLCDLGISKGSVISLMVIPRSGPLKFVEAPVQKNQEPTCSKYLKYHRSSDLSQSGEESFVAERGKVARGFTEEDKAEAQRRADDNLRTMAKMRDIRINMERLKIDKKRKSLPSEDKLGMNVADSVIVSSNRQRKPAALTGGQSASTPTTRSARLNIPPKSAPEDTSAKESSAGETEFETEGGADLMRHAKCRSERSSGVPSQMKAALNKMRPLRAISSSSDQESSAAMLTASDSEIAGGVGDEEGDVSEYWSYDEGTRLTKRCDSTTDPSEMSSGMIVCDMDHEFRKSKVKRRYPIAGTSKLTAAEVGVMKQQARPAGRVRPRSKPRPQQMVSPNSFNDSKISTCEGDSSSDDDAKSDRSVRATPITSIPSSSVVIARKVSAQMARVKMRGYVMNHKQPQSSQSQLRCATCGYRLTNTSTFHCRCGKTCCHKHRNPEQHTCSYFEVTHISKQNRNLGFVPECSD